MPCLCLLALISSYAYLPQASKLRALISESAVSAVKRRHVQEAQARTPQQNVDRGLKGKLEEMHMEELDVVRLHSTLEELNVCFRLHLHLSHREIYSIYCISFSSYFAQHA